MSDAQSRFADAQRATGQAAEEVSGQSQVANAPLREALEMASKLSAGRGGSQPGDHAGQGSQEGSAPGDGQEGSQSVGGDASGASDGDSSLGTGFVPNSPEVTADMMAGQSALAQAHAALGGEGRGKGKGKGKGQGKGKGDHEGDHQGAGRGKGGSASGGNSGNSSSVGGDAPPPGALLSGPLQAMDVQSIKATDVRGGGGGDSAPASRSFGEESWMSRLPPELRQAIRARAQRRAPRDYEERLNRYFESLE
jgi:hypothetical protein